MHVRLLALLLLFSCPLLHAAAPPALLSPEQRERLDERDRLVARFRSLGAVDPDKAVAVLQKTVALERDLFGRFSKQALHRLEWLVTVQTGRGQYIKALATRREMLRIIEQLYGKDDHRATNAHWEVVSAQKRLNLTAEETEAHQKLFRLNARTRMYSRQGQPDVALPYALEWLDLHVKLWGKKHPHTIHAINNVGVLYLDLGDFSRARKYLEEAGKLYRMVLGEKHPAYAAWLTCMSNLSEAMNDFHGAIALSERSAALFRATEGEYSSFHATSLNALAVRYARHGNLLRARDLLHQVLAIRSAVPGDRRSEIVEMHNLGRVYLLLGDKDKAARMHERGLELANRLVGDTQMLQADGLDLLAQLAASQGRARASYRLALHAHEIRRSLLAERHPAIARSHRSLAEIDLVLNRLDRATVRAGHALSLSFAHLEGAVSGLSGQQRAVYLDDLSHTLDVYLTVAGERIPAAAQYEWVARYKGLAPALAAEERLGRDDPSVARLLARLRQVRGALARLAAQTPTPAESDRWRKLFDQIDQQKEELEREVAQASTRFAKLRRRPTARAVAAALPKDSALVEFVVYSLSQPGHCGRQELLAFVLRPDREPVRIVIGPQYPIAWLIHAWRESISERADPHPAIAAALRARLWQPLEKHLAGVKTVLIAPDDELFRLPFAALPGRKAGTFLLEDFAIATLSSGRQLLFPPAKAPAGVSGLLVLGGLDYGTPRRRDKLLARPTSWPVLPGTAVELNQITRIFRSAFPGERSKRLTGADASRSGVLIGMQTRPRWLHLSTHGYYDTASVLVDPVRGASCVGAAAQTGLAAFTGVASAALAADHGPSLVQSIDLGQRAERTFGRNPLLLTSLVLSGVNDRGDEGYLTAEEISALDLRGCELAVLSACDTGLGKLSAWQGVQGLQQGFHQAGVAAVVSSLWSVHDAATSVLMEEFYKRLFGKEKMSKREALRQAQLFVLKNPLRVSGRARELRTLLVKKGISESVLAARGIGRKALTLPAGGTVQRSPVLWWAPWILSESEW